MEAQSAELGDALMTPFSEHWASGTLKAADYHHRRLV
jgi:hypothetical protein